tara:strand:- start:333 stop:953 length:621 start_codon:yes stop_codon:yes gene_type:complete
MKSKKIKISLFYSILVLFILRLLFIFIPIYSSEAKLIIPKIFRIGSGIDLGAHTGTEKCLAIIVNLDKLNNQTIYNLTSRSLNKQKSIECINNGVDYIKYEINTNNDKVNQLLLKSFDLNNKIDNLIININSSKSLNKDKLILINDFFINKNLLKKYTEIPLPLPYEINTNPIKYYSLFRYLFSGFILFFWISYVFLGDFNKKNND